MVVVDCNATHCRWRPDVTFLHLDPEQVIFPRHDADAWAKGDKRTASEGSHIGKLVNINLEGMASRVHAFLKNMQLTLLEIETILAVANGSIQEAACHWITSNKEWEKWIPIKTACRPSDGLVDRRFNFVSTRQAAVDCGLCLPGHFSEILVDHLGQTRRCSQCSAGPVQLGDLQLSRANPNVLRARWAATQPHVAVKDVKDVAEDQSGPQIAW